MIVFDEAKHLYTDNGLDVPSVTKVLQDAGMIDFSNVPAHILEASSKFGTAVHKACELFDNDDLDESSLDVHIKPYLDAWFKFKKDTCFMVEAVEEIIYSKKFRFAGKLDRRGILEKRAVVDLKTGSTLLPSTAIQTGAYEGGYNEDKKRDEQIKRRFSVLLKPDGNYKIQEYKNKTDFSVFLSALTIYNWKRGNK